VCYQGAIDEYLREKSRPLNLGERKRGFQPIVDKWNVSKSTLERLVNGGASISTFNASKRKLTYVEERVLVEFILESSDRGLPPSLKSIEEHANVILAGQEQPDEPVGNSWVGRFLDCY